MDYDKPPLNFEPPLFVWSLALFLALVFVGRKVVWQPLIAGLDSREARVNQAYARAEAAKTQIQELIREHAGRMAAAQDEVKGIVAASRQEAEQAKSGIVAAATAEARTLQEQTIADITKARNQALAELSAVAERHAALATEHVLGYSLSNP